MKTQIFTFLLFIGLLISQVGSAGVSFFNQKNIDQTENLNIFPNPINGKGTIEINMGNSGNAKIEFYDLSGKKVKEFKEVFLSEGMNKIEFNAEKLKEGYYFLKITTDQWVKAKRILVRR